jgi:hypothetical protein
MSVRTKFDSLVKGLDGDSLTVLRESVTAELAGREGAAELISAFEIGSIHPGMTAADKEQASREIARVLREQG